MNLRIKAILTWVALAALAGSYVFCWRHGYQTGLYDADMKCKEAQLAELNAIITSARDLAKAANEASLALGKTISDRQIADRQTTREIRYALAITAPARADCVFDDNVMRQLSAARDRATRAATGGLGRAVSPGD